MPLRVCCLAYHAYPVIEPTAKGDYGGTETRAWLFARGLAAIAGLEVSFVVRSRRPLVQRTYDGVRLIRRIAPLWWLRYRVASRVERVSRFPWLRIRRWSGSLVADSLARGGLSVPERAPQPESAGPLFHGDRGRRLLLFRRTQGFRYVD